VADKSDSNQTDHSAWRRLCKYMPGA